VGVSKDYRIFSYGRSLVLAALHDATENGFRELLISEAGPIEFYERILPLKLHTKEKG
jgi:N-acetylglutamate synthase-like GNAT family acetyltransferase